MSILAIFKGKGFTKEMYENARKEIDWEHKNPAGAVFHAAAFDDGGMLHVVDVWDSAESMDAFFKDRLAPAFKKLNIPFPEYEVFPAHNINTYPSIDQYKV